MPCSMLSLSLAFEGFRGRIAVRMTWGLVLLSPLASQAWAAAGHSSLCATLPWTKHSPWAERHDLHVLSAEWDLPGEAQEEAEAGQSPGPVSVLHSMGSVWGLLSPSTSGPFAHKGWHGSGVPVQSQARTQVPSLSLRRRWAPDFRCSVVSLTCPLHLAGRDCQHYLGWLAASLSHPPHSC